MTAGTVVITGGILATVILLGIIAVLCYCRLQYYCCSKNGSDSGSVSQRHFAGSASGLDGSVVTPLSVSPPPPGEEEEEEEEEEPGSPDPTGPSGGPRSYCPSCSPYDSPFYVRTTDELRNGGERVAYMPTHYENRALATPLPGVRGPLLRDARRGRPPDLYTNTRAISTEV